MRSIRSALGASLRGSIRASIGPLATIALVVALWAAFKAVFGVKDFVLPSPLGVLRAFEADPRTFLVGVRETATSAAIGFAIAAPVFWMFTQLLAINLPGITSTGWL